MATALDTLANVKTHLGVTGSGDDALLDQLRATADDVVARLCGRAFDGGSFVEYFDGGARVLVLANYPVLAGTEVRVDPGRTYGTDSILATDRYLVNTERGLVRLPHGGPFVPGAPANAYPNSVKVSYATATAAVPAAVTRAYAELVGHWYRQVKTWVATDQQNVRQQTDGTIVTEYPWGQAGGFDVPKGVRRLLDSVRTPML